MADGSEQEQQLLSEPTDEGIRSYRDDSPTIGYRRLRSCPAGYRGDTVQIQAQLIRTANSEQRVDTDNAALNRSPKLKRLRSDEENPREGILYSNSGLVT